MPPSPSQAEADRQARRLRLRLLRQLRTLERGNIDRFLTLSEALSQGFSGILPGLAGASPALIRECQTLLTTLDELSERGLHKTGQEVVRIEIERKIREFLAKKEEP